MSAEFRTFWNRMTWADRRRFVLVCVMALLHGFAGGKPEDFGR